MKRRLSVGEFMRYRSSNIKIIQRIENIEPLGETLQVRTIKECFYKNGSLYVITITTTEGQKGVWYNGANSYHIERL